MGFGGLAGRGKKKQDPPIEQDLYVSLEEVFFGCVKKVKISRRVMNEDGHTSSVRDKILTVEVKPGWPAGTAISFEREGDQGPNTVPADIVFVLRDKPHARFRREGPHLVHVAHIPLHAALAGCTLDVDTLDDRLIHVPIVEIVKCAALNAFFATLQYSCLQAHTSACARQVTVSGLCSIAGPDT